VTESPATELPATDVPTEEPTKSPTGTPVPDDDDGAVVAAVIASEVSVTVSCRTDPETIRVTNNGAGPLQITALASLFDRTAGEPFAVDRTLQPGKTAIYQAGHNAQYGTILTTSFLFTNSAYEQDGIKVVTSAGNVYQRCAANPVTPTPTPVVTTDQIKVTLNCLSTAETIRVTNNGAAPILIKGLATMFEPIAEEPFAASRTLKPGHTAIFQAGTDAKYGTDPDQELHLHELGLRQGRDPDQHVVGKLYKRCDAKPQPVGEKWIDVNLSAQWATAYVGNTPVNSTIVATGKPGWETPTGTHYIIYKYRYDTMAGNERARSGTSRRPLRQLLHQLRPCPPRQVLEQQLRRPDLPRLREPAHGLRRVVLLLGAARHAGLRPLLVATPTTNEAGRLIRGAPLFMPADLVSERLASPTSCSVPTDIALVMSSEVETSPLSDPLDKLRMTVSVAWSLRQISLRQAPA
jgi:hypothetical protein